MAEDHDLDSSIRAQLEAAGCTCTMPSITFNVMENRVVVEHEERCPVVRHLMAEFN